MFFLLSKEKLKPQAMCFSHRQGTIQACTEDSDQEGRKLTLLFGRK